MSKRRFSRKTLGNVSLATLAVVTLGAVGFTLVQNPEPVAVPTQVQHYYDENVKNARSTPTTAVAAPTALTGEGMLGAVQQAVAGPEPIVISVLGDSTGNGPGEWVDLWAKHLTKYGTVTLHQWDQATDSWEAEPKVYPGGSKPIKIWNGSKSGTTYIYSLERLDTVQPEKPAFTILNFGHNMAATGADVGSAQLLEAVDKKWATPIPAVITLQNPARGERESRTQSSVAALSQWAPRAGYPTIDVNKAFTSAGPLDALLQDDVHPNPAGSQIWADTVASTLG